MTNLKLVFPTDEYREEWHSIVREIENSNEKMTPFAKHVGNDSIKGYITNSESVLKAVLFTTFAGNKL